MLFSLKAVHAFRKKICTNITQGTRLAYGDRGVNYWIMPTNTGRLWWSIITSKLLFCWIWDFRKKWSTLRHSDRSDTNVVFYKEGLKNTLMCDFCQRYVLSFCDGYEYVIRGLNIRPFLHSIFICKWFCTENIKMSSTHVFQITDEFCNLNWIM